MISAKEAGIQTRKNIKTKTQIRPKQRLLPKNEGKQYFIPIPFKLVVVESAIEEAISAGMNFVKIHNEITPEAEQTLIENGYAVIYYKTFIKIIW